MIRLDPEQLGAQLREKLYRSYLLFGNDPLLLQESQDAVRRVAQQHDFAEHFSFALDNHTNWDDIFRLCQAGSLFSGRQSLLLTLADTGPGILISEQLVKLAGLLHEDILFILRGGRLTRTQENSLWFKTLGKPGVYVNCQSPQQVHLKRWVLQRAGNLNISLDEQATQLLCYCYEGNLLGLSQALDRLALLWPATQLSLMRVEQVISDEAHFSLWHWLDALLMGKSQRVWHILQQLRLSGTDPLILLRAVQSELLLLLTLKRQMAGTPLRTLFNQHKVWQHRRNLVGQALQRLSVQQLQQMIRLLTQMEIGVKQDYSQSIWAQLESLSMLMCAKSLPESFFDAQ